MSTNFDFFRSELARQDRIYAIEMRILYDAIDMLVVAEVLRWESKLPAIQRALFKMIADHDRTCKYIAIKGNLLIKAYWILQGLLEKAKIEVTITFDELQDFVYEEYEQTRIVLLSSGALQERKAR